MSIIGIIDCACAEFEGNAFPFPAQQIVWLKGQKGIRKALQMLLARDQRIQDDPDDDRILYQGGIHVDRIHVLSVLDDDGTVLYESVLRKQTRLFGRLLEPEEIKCSLLFG